MVDSDLKTRHNGLAHPLPLGGVRLYRRVVAAVLVVFLAIVLAEPDPAPDHARPTLPAHYRQMQVAQRIVAVQHRMLAFTR